MNNEADESMQFYKYSVNNNNKWNNVNNSIFSEMALSEYKGIERVICVWYTVILKIVLLIMQIHIQFMKI